MKKCGNCFFFHNKFPVYDTNFSCSELFQEEKSSPCQEYVKAPLRPSSLKPSNLEGLPTISHQQEFMDIITDIFSVDKDIVSVMETVKREIEAQGYDIPFQSNKVIVLSGKLSDLYLLYRLTLSYGLGAFADQIMTLHIEKLFSDPRKYLPKQAD